MKNYKVVPSKSLTCHGALTGSLISDFTFVFKIFAIKYYKLISNKTKPSLWYNMQTMPTVSLEVFTSLYLECTLLKSKHGKLHSWVCGFLPCHFPHPVTASQCYYHKLKKKNWQAFWRRWKVHLRPSCSTTNLNYSKLPTRQSVETCCTTLKLR